MGNPRPAAKYQVNCQVPPRSVALSGKRIVYPSVAVFNILYVMLTVGILELSVLQRVIYRACSSPVSSGQSVALFCCGCGACRDCRHGELMTFVGDEGKRWG